ncbi:MAG TPA: efflux RND transporter permease subunit [Candidatus Dormibacteraeota bacterium]|nr:efflux RND transporter permease subunit [Candidatus Dormibacteraeota bacterium]
MLNAIVRFSLRFRGIVIALGFALLGYGLYSLANAKYDVFPEFAPPLVVIQTEAPGLSPEQVELLVTTPVEIATNGVSGIESLRSGSIQGLSVVTVTFQSGTDLYRARQVVAERLATLAGQLPQGVKSPIMTPLTSSTSIVSGIGLTSDKLSQMRLRTVADWTVRLRLLAVPGVANVTVFGGEVKQYQFQFIPERLIQYSLTVDDVLNAARRATGISGAGYIDTGNQRLVLQSEGQSLTPTQLADTVLVHENGANVILGQVAHVIEAPEPPFGAASIGGKPGVILMVEAQYGANTLEVTGAVEQALEGLRPALNQEGVQVRPDLFRPANFIQTALTNIRSSLIIGAILVVVILFLFLFDFRTAAISCTAIPLSLLAAVTVMGQMGFTLNTMTLGGLAIAIGEVVDDAVIDVENIFRRLRENRRSETPKPALRVVFDASIEVRSAVVYATFAVALVFIPILTMSGVAGRIFAPLGVAYILSILASLLVALSVTPALSYIFLGKRELKEQEPPVVRWLKERYRSILLAVERAPRLVIAAVTLVTLLGLAMVPFFSASFLPELREGHFILHMSTVPGTSLDESLRIGSQVSQELLKIPYVRSVAQRVGRAEASADVWGTHYSEFEVDLKPNLSGDENELAQAAIRKSLGQFAGVNFSLKTFLTERIEETLSGYQVPVVVNIYGYDLNALDQEAQDVQRILSKVPGASGVQIQSPPGTPQVAIQLRPSDVARWGFDPVSVLGAIRTAYRGETVGQVYEGNRVFGVSVILPPEDRKSMAAIKSLPLRSPSGNYVGLGQLATVYETSGRYIVLHGGARRVQTITCNVSGVPVDSFVKDARQQILSQVALLPGSYVEFSGTAAAQARSRRDLLIHSGLAGLGILMLLSIVMMNFRNLLLVLANIPFALVGGVLTVFAMGGTLSLGPLVGFITLFGITLRNSIMMISHYEHLVNVEGMSWGLDAAIRGASERLAPILMTATVTGLGLLPLAIGSGAPGREIEGPMAIVILGGLITSTALNLLVLPTLALRYGRFERIIPEM